MCSAARGGGGAWRRVNMPHQLLYMREVAEQAVILGEVIRHEEDVQQQRQPTARQRLGQLAGRHVHPAQRVAHAVGYHDAQKGLQAHSKS